MRLFQTLVLVAAALLPAAARPSSATGVELPPGRTTFRVYGNQDGLGNLAVLCLAQDRTGFMWVGTEDGLYRYDGRRFQAFGTDEGLPSGYITQLKVDGRGVLWAGTFNGLARFDGARFATAKEVPVSAVQDIDTGADGRIVVASQDGVYRQDGADGFEAIPGWAGGHPTAVCAGQGRLWVASQDGAATRLAAFEGGAWKPFPGDAFGTRRVDALVQDRSGRVWARGQHALWSLQPGASRFEPAGQELPIISSRGMLSLDADGALLVPTDQGLWMLRDGRWSSLGTANGLPSPLSRVAVRDREGSLWLGGFGVCRMLGAGLWSAYTKAEGLPDSVVWTVFRDHERHLFVGTDHGLAGGGPDGWKTVPGTAGKVIRTAVEAPDGGFYLGTAPAAVLHWSPRSRGVDAVYGADAGLGAKRLFRLLLDADGTLWAATEDAGLLRADTHARPLRFTREELPGGTADENLNGLTRGASGRIYACGAQGLAVRSGGHWRRYTDKDGLKRAHVAYALELADGSVVIGYFESMGLSRVRFQAGGSLVVEPDPGGPRLAKEKIYMLGQDSRGRIWVGTGRGVFLGQDGAFQHFGLGDGLVGEDIDNMAFLADPGGDVWVGTSSGLARFDAAGYAGPPAPPRTVFLQRAFADRVIGAAEGEPAVPHRDATLQVGFAGLSFLGEGRIHYEVRLDGLESAWHGTDAGEARYPALAAGRYALRVRARVGEGSWGPDAVFPFTVQPPWWQAWWFRALAALAAAGFVAALIGWRVASLRKRNEELSALVRARTSELEAANGALQSQSLTDSLTGLKNRRYLGVCMPEDVALVRRTHRELLSHRRDRTHVNIDLVLAMVDLDHFKEVNDLHGHAAGDLVLKQVAEVLKEATRDTDTVVRWGGEEFLVVARNAARKEAIVLMERIRSRIAGHAFDLGDGRAISRTCSIGFALMPFLCAEPDFMNWEEVVDVADHCLYVAKHSGRDAWVGVMPAPDITSEQLGPKVAQRLHGLVRTPLVEVLTSQPDPSRLPWGADA